MVNTNNQGYRIKMLYDGKNGKRKGMLVHRLVMMTFIGNPPEGQPEVNHKDGNPLNNRIDNLEWCSHQENMDHAWENGLVTIDRMRGYNTAPDWHLRKPGDEHPKTKWSDSLKEEIRVHYAAGKPFAELMRMYPEIPKCTLWSFISGRRK